MESHVSMLESGNIYFIYRMLRTLTQAIGNKFTLKSTLLKTDPFSFAFTKSALLHLLSLLVNKGLSSSAYVSQMGTITFWSPACSLIKHYGLFDEDVP